MVIFHCFLYVHQRVLDTTPPEMKLSVTSCPGARECQGSGDESPTQDAQDKDEKNVEEQRPPVLGGIGEWEPRDDHDFFSSGSV